MNDWPSVTTVLREWFEKTYGALDFDPDAKMTELPCGCRRYSGGNEYTKRGQAVGELMDALVTGQEVNPAYLEWFNRHDDWRPYIEAGRKFLRENPPSEKPITQMHLEDKLQKFKGHADWIWSEQGKVTDVKTGSMEPPEWLGMQTMGYALMLPRILPQVFYKREILWLRNDGDYRIIPHENDAHDCMDFITELNHWWVMKARLNGKAQR